MVELRGRRVVNGIAEPAGTLGVQALLVHPLIQILHIVQFLMELQCSKWFV